MKTAEALARFGRNINIQHFSHDVSGSGFFLVAATKLLHLREDHPGQGGHDDSASDEHFHVRNRESPGRRDSDCLHRVPPNYRAVSISGLMNMDSFHGLPPCCAAE